MLFAIGLVAMFTIGGLSGVTHAVAPADTQQTDTYYIVAHFHYVLFGGALFGLLRRLLLLVAQGLRLLPRTSRLGKVHFWLTLIGFNLTFGPMHILGLQGMSPPDLHLPRTATASTSGTWCPRIGAFIIAVSILVFFWPTSSQLEAQAASAAAARARPVGRPQPRVDASRRPPRSTTSTTIPTVTQLDEFWHRKYGEDETGRTVRDRRRPRRSPRPATPPASTCRRRRTGPWSCRSACPLIGYGLIFNLASPPSGGAPRARRHLRLGPRARRRRREPAAPPRPDRGPRRPATATAELAAGEAEPAAAPPSAEEASVDELTTAVHERATESATSPGTGHGHRPPGSPTRSWRCGCSSARTACCSAA